MSKRKKSVLSEEDLRKLKNGNFTEEDVEKNITEKLNEASEEIKEMAEEINKFEESKTELGQAIEKNPEKAEELIKNEIKRVETLKKEVEQKISSKRPGTFTGWWNGMGYDI